MFNAVTTTLSLVSASACLLHYGDAYEQNSTYGACFYELSPEIRFEISPVSSVLLSLQQMHLNVSNLFAACATTRAKEGRERLRDQPGLGIYILVAAEA